MYWQADLAQYGTDRIPGNNGLAFHIAQFSYARGRAEFGCAEIESRRRVRCNKVDGQSLGFSYRDLELMKLRILSSPSCSFDFSVARDILT